MSEHPIDGIMITAMNKIKDMVDVNTIVGDAISCSNDTVIIPISQVSFGFAAGGSEFKGETIDEYNKQDKDEKINYRLPFGGGAGAGVTIKPIAFLVVVANVVKLLPVDHSSTIDKFLDYMPDLIEKTNCMMDKCLKDKKDLKETKKDIEEIAKKLQKEEQE